jgi:hypothetical protein
MKKKHCNKCGGDFHPKGWTRHTLGCTGKIPIIRKRTYKKREPSLKRIYTNDVMVIADVRLHINLTKAIQLGVAKVQEVPQ